MSITTTYKQFTIKASYKGNKSWETSNDFKMQNFNNHMIKVTNTETQQSVTFEYWNSIVKGEITEEQEVLFAFYCFLSDAVGASESFDNFCGEFGYDTDSRKAEKIYRKCKKQLEKLNKIYDGDIYSLVNELQEVAG